MSAATAGCRSQIRKEIPLSSSATTRRSRLLISRQPVSSEPNRGILGSSSSTMLIITIWESEQHADATMERPEFQEALREAGVSRDDVQPKQQEVLKTHFCD